MPDPGLKTQGPDSRLGTDRSSNRKHQCMVLWEMCEFQGLTGVFHTSSNSRHSPYFHNSIPSTQSLFLIPNSQCPQFWNPPHFQFPKSTISNCSFFQLFIFPTSQFSNFRIPTFFNCPNSIFKCKRLKTSVDGALGNVLIPGANTGISHVEQFPPHPRDSATETRD